MLSEEFHVEILRFRQKIQLSYIFCKGTILLDFTSYLLLFRFSSSHAVATSFSCSLTSISSCSKPSACLLAILVSSLSAASFTCVSRSCLARVWHCTWRRRLVRSLICSQVFWGIPLWKCSNLQVFLWRSLLLRQPPAQLPVLSLHFVQAAGDALQRLQLRRDSLLLFDAALKVHLPKVKHVPLQQRPGLEERPKRSPKFWLHPDYLLK